MTIRLATREDLPAIAALYLQNHRSAYRGLLSEDYLSGLSTDGCAEKWAAALSRAGERVWAAQEGDSLLGFAAGLPDAELPRTWYLESLHVAKTARGRGVGTALIRHAARAAAAEGCERMSVCIVRGNERAGDLYRRLGAVHFLYFEDSFGDERFASEKLVWETLPTEA